ncbi:MAG TPA: hypothetical protein VFX22_11395, partial [Candidatus Kapabacteria bacterium]|nr:hypothetical protein [Candidatus Kapabacteria bacterium]
MKKLYAFLLVMLAFGLLSSGVARAQFTMSNFVVRAVTAPDAQGLGSDGSGSWNPISGGTNTGLQGNSDGARYSQAYNVPFNFTFLNTQITTSNVFRVNDYGSVSFDPDGPNDGAGYDYGSEDWFILSEYGYTYDYVPYGLYDNEGDYGPSNHYYLNYKIAPFEGFLSYYNSAPGFAITWTTLGSAPTRELVVQSLGVPGYEYGPSPNVQGSWQAIVYEAGISHFRINYGPQAGTWNGSFGYNYNYGGWLVEAYAGYTAVKTTGGTYLTIGWNGNGHDASVQPLVQYSDNYSRSGYYNPSFQGWAAEDNASQENHLPLASYDIRLPYAYDFSVDAITTPSDQALESKNVLFTPTATITNQGASTPSSLQVNFTIAIKGGPQVYNQTITIPGNQLPQGLTFGSMSAMFPQFAPHDTMGYDGYNIYEDTVIVFNMQPTADADPSNNEITNEWICAPPNDIKAVAILTPPTGTSPQDRTPLAVVTPISLRFRNSGSNPSGETNVPLSVVVRDPSGAVIYRDTVIIPNWPEGALGGNSDGNSDFSTSGTGPGKGPYYDTTFGSFTPSVVGQYKICGVAIMANDQLRGDDTICGPVLVRPTYDAAATSIVVPAPDEEVPANTTWQPAATFQSEGVSDLFDVPVTVNIYSCSNPT